MKVSCPSCHANYSIPDEKLPTKVKKVKCKKCGGVMVVMPLNQYPHPDEAEISYIEFEATEAANRKNKDSEGDKGIPNNVDRFYVSPNIPIKKLKKCNYSNSTKISKK